VTVRLGVQDPNLAGAGYRRILQGQTLHLHTISDTAVTLRAWARVIYDDGTGQLLTIPEAARSASRIAEDLLSTDVVIHNGWVVNAEVEMLTGSVKRGQTYVRLTVEPFGAALLSDYCFSEFGHVSLGTFIQTGPGGGGGNLRVVTIKANGAPATFTFRPGVANQIRKIHSIAWLYASSSTSASRSLAVFWRFYGGIPTGMAGSPTTNLWEARLLALSSDQDGMVFADEKMSGTNDNGTVTIDDITTAPTPFPIWVAELDNLEFEFLVQLEEADDFDVAYSLVEDWIVL